ncbi:MAG TPA: PHP domain-containing protein, partial [Usitatibacteraceae bacterium]|nr:PHP domain-containing protein [Usitatibacteraceae bacterium]
MKLSAAALNCLSNFSFLKGASHAEDLVAQAHKLGYAAIAITDECSVSGMVRAHVAAREHGMRLICGAGFAVHDCPALEALLLLAPDREAWGDLCELITRARRRSAKGGYRLELADLSGVPGCLAIALPHTLHAAIDAAIARIGALFPARAWLGAALAYGPDDRGKRDRLVALGERHALPVTLCERILFAVREDKPLHDVLTAVRLKKPVA